MVITDDIVLPEIEDLNVNEVNLSTSTLMAASPYLGKACEGVNNEFMLCRQETNDPRACVSLGKSVTACTMWFFKTVKGTCAKEFNQYANCVDKSSGDYKLSQCRKTQAVFDYCMNENLGIARPHFGYFCRARVHRTPRPAPPDPPCPCDDIVEDPTPALPDCKKRRPARFTSRAYWLTE